MKWLDAVLNVVITVAVTMALAYLGLQFDHGLFTILPERVTGFFLDHGGLLPVAVVVLVAALVAKIPVGRSIRQRDRRGKV